MRHRSCPILIVALLCVAGWAHGQNSKPELVEPPEWIWTHLNQMYGVDTPEQLEQAVQLGAQVIHPGQPDMKDPVKVEACRKLVAAAHKHGVKVILGGSVIYFKFDILKEHPDWRVHWVDDPKLVESAPGDQHPQIRACINSPFGDYFIDQMVEMAKELNSDGASFDGYHIELCYCKYCKEKYRKATGLEIPKDVAQTGRTDGGDLKVAGNAPKKLDLQNPEFVRYFRWREQALLDHFTRFRAAMRKVKPDFAFISWSINAGRWGHLSGVPRYMPFTMNALFDCPMQEWWMDETNRGGSVTPAAFGARLIRASVRERPSVCNPYDFTHFEDLWQAGYASSMPLTERKFRFCLAITNGSLPATSLGAPYAPGESKELARTFTACQRWLVRAKSVKWCALVVSDDTRNFYGGGSAIGNYVEHCFGAFRALSEAHVPFDLITDQDLEENKLSDYKVIILANTACLSDRAANNIRNFAAGGGGVVATVESSRYDENGQPRPDFALADIFGAHFQQMALEIPSTGLPDAPKPTSEAGVWDSAGSAKGAIYPTASAPDEIIDAKLKEFSATGWGFVGKCAAVTPTDEKSVCATVNIREAYDKPASAEAAKGKMPAMVLSKPGAGRVVYFPAGIDQGYWAYPYPYQRMLLVNTVRWAAGSAPSIRIQAPMLVEATFYTQKDKNGHRTIVHLLNEINSTATHASPTGCDTPTREEIVPVHDLKVTFTEARPKRVHLEPEGKNLHIDKVVDGWMVTVPRLEMHSMVVAED